MIRYAATAVVVAGLALASPVRAGEYNKKLSVGDAAPVWSGLAGTDDKTHALSDLKDKNVVVVVFTTNGCPVAQMYENRIIDFARKHAGPDSKVALVAVNSNTGPEDRLPEMKERARAKGFPYPYLFDESQKIGRAYGATVTPEFFVLNKDRKVVYMGAMDDANRVTDTKVNYLEPAVEAALRGQTSAKAETRARGCSIQYKKVSK